MKKFEMAEMEVVKFEATDIISTSGGQKEDETDRV